MAIISGLLLTFDSHPEDHSRTLEQLRTCAGLELGAAAGRWLPVVMIAEDGAHSQAAHDWLLALPGVQNVEVIHVNFEEPHMAPNNANSMAMED